MMKKLLFAMLAAIMAIGVNATEIPIYGDVTLSDYYAMFDGSGATPDNDSYEGRANYWFKYNSNLSIAMICWVEGFSASPIQGNSLTLPTTVTIDGKSHKVVGLYKPGSNNIFRDGTQNLTTLNIPEGYEFIYGDYALNLEALTSLKLPASLKWISVWALDKCTAVTTLTLADNATTPLHVEGYKAYGAGLCSSMPLTTVTIGRNIECDGAFFSYSNFPCAANLKNVTITGAVRTLPEYLFYDMPKLNNLTIHEGLTAISKGAFEYCTALTSVTIPGSVKRIADDAFRYDGELVTLNLGNGVQTIGECAFRDCKKVTSLTLPASLQSINVWAFQDMTGVKTLTIEDSATPLWVQHYRAFRAGLFTDFAEGFTCYMGRNFDLHADDDAGVSLADPPLRASKVGKVTMSDYVTALNLYEFDNCNLLTTVTPSKNITEIPERAFYNNEKLTGFTVPDKVTAIGVQAFAYDTSMVALDLGKGVKTIAESAFRDCKKVTGLTLPASLQSINVWAFQGMTGVKTLTIEDSATPLWVQHYRGFQQGLFTDFAEGFTCYMGRNFDLHADDDAGVSLADPPLRASKVGKVTMSDRVTALNLYEFDNCNLLTMVTPSKNITEIPERAFYNNEKLTGFSVPDKVTAIGVQAFAYDTSMVALDLGKGVKTIAENAFRDCKKVTSLTLPASLQSINVWAFQGMTGVKTLTIEDSATPLWVQHYRGFQQGLFTDFAEGFTCYMGRNYDLHADDDAGVSLADPPLRASKVGELTLGVAVGPLNDSEFENCKKLTKITSAATTVPTCPSANVFYNVNKDIPVYVPKNSIAAYQAAIGWELFTNIQKIAKRGDIDGNDTVDIGDINIIINTMLGKTGEQFDGGDLNGDGKIDIADINMVINIMLGK